MLGVPLVIMMTVSFWAQPSWARNTPAPVVDATGAGSSGSSSSSSSRSSLEARLSRLENQTLLDLMERMDSLQNEVQRMLGEMEEQAHSMDSLNKRQRDLYLDIDQRLRKIEQGNVAAPAMGAFVPAPVPASTASMSPGSEGSVASSASAQTAAPGAPSDAQQERLSYEKAFGSLKDGRYDQAVVALTAFMKSYPQGRFAGNAQYWLGEANYAQRHFTLALKDFEKVVKNYPASPKRADAMLKMGYTYQELAQMDKARSSLQNVSKSYPKSTAANLAQKRLQELNRLR